MKRREFLTKTAAGIGAGWLGTRGAGRGFALPAAEAGSAAPGVPVIASSAPSATRFSAADMVELGSTGIKTSRLAMGTGTVGVGHHSHQTALGIDGLSNLLRNGYDHGLRFFDLADAYGSHPHAAEALKHLPREKVTVLTKSWSRDASALRADIDRFRKELGVDYIDVFLMHCLSRGDWTESYKPAMDVLSEAKQKGIIRAHGCSCHTLEALRASARSPWVEVQLSRINPIGSHMDADPDTVLAVLKDMRAQGKAVVGMKILGQGDMRTRQDEALKFALSTGVLSAFTIGAESINEQEDLMHRISAVSLA